MLWGLISYFIPERNEPFMVPIRVLLLAVGGMASVFGSELIGFGGAGPLACVSVAFFSLVAWSRLGWEIEDNPASTAFEIFWMIFEPILFGITGTAIKFKELKGDVVYLSVGILVAAAIIRMLVTVVFGIGCKLNLKEKIFASIALMAKATVQVSFTLINRLFRTFFSVSVFSPTCLILLSLIFSLFLLLFSSFRLISFSIFVGHFLSLFCFAFLFVSLMCTLFRI